MNYYSESLSANRLKRCYDLAPDRVRRYLEEETKNVLGKIIPGAIVLELGCGYGRVLSRLSEKAAVAVGIDTSLQSLQLFKEYLSDKINIHISLADAGRLSFRENIFDAVVCIQNGISAFHTPVDQLINESIRVAKTGGIILFSSYSDKFWNQRLEWFRHQSEASLIGEIDYEKTGNGDIVCKDGFTASTVSPAQFQSFFTAFPVEIKVYEVDESSIFCEVIKK